MKPLIYRVLTRPGFMLVELLSNGGEDMAWAVGVGEEDLHELESSWSDADSEKHEEEMDSEDVFSPVTKKQTVGKHFNSTI